MGGTRIPLLGLTAKDRIKRSARHFRATITPPHHTVVRQEYPRTLPRLRPRPGATMPNPPSSPATGLPARRFVRLNLRHRTRPTRTNPSSALSTCTTRSSTTRPVAPRRKGRTASVSLLRPHPHIYGHRSIPRRPRPLQLLLGLPLQSSARRHRILQPTRSCLPRRRWQSWTSPKRGG